MLKEAIEKEANIAALLALKQYIKDKKLVRLPIQ
jgi:hypothetical protein